MTKITFFDLSTAIIIEILIEASTWNPISILLFKSVCKEFNRILYTEEFNIRIKTFYEKFDTKFIEYFYEDKLFIDKMKTYNFIYNFVRKFALPEDKHKCIYKNSLIQFIEQRKTDAVHIKPDYDLIVFHKGTIRSFHTLLYFAHKYIGSNKYQDLRKCKNISHRHKRCFRYMRNPPPIITNNTTKLSDNPNPSTHSRDEYIDIDTSTLDEIIDEHNTYIKKYKSIYRKIKYYREEIHHSTIESLNTLKCYIMQDDKYDLFECEITESNINEITEYIHSIKSIADLKIIQ